MTSKEKIENIRNWYSFYLNHIGVGKLSNKEIEDFEEIEKDLEVLDILSNCFKLVCYGIIDFDKNPIFPYPGDDKLYDNYTKVREWIERNKKKVV